MREECFVRNGNEWTVAPSIGKASPFSTTTWSNIRFPSLINNLSAFDLIICRNVMIYFGSDLMQRMIDQFHECLQPSGWLLVGPAEPNMTSFARFRVVNAPGVTLYQKREEPPSQPPFVWPESLPPAPPAPAAESAIDETKAAAPAPAPEALLEVVRAHADRGAWEDAARSCERLLARDPLNSRAHFFHGLVLEQLKRHGEAHQALRRSIYLDRQSILPHYYLGLFQQTWGDARTAARSLERALDLLEPRKEADIFEDADGITVAEMKKLVRIHLEILQAGA